MNEEVEDADDDHADVERTDDGPGDDAAQAEEVTAADLITAGADDTIERLIEVGHRAGRLLVRIGGWWGRYGCPERFARVADRLSRDGRFQLVRGADFERSARYVRERDDGFRYGASCYWNAARLLLNEPELAGANYVEGLSVQTLPPAGTRGASIFQRWNLDVQMEGFLELGGEVIDPTAAYNAQLWAKHLRPEIAMQRSLYIPIQRWQRDEVGDRWDEIPLSIVEQDALGWTVNAIGAVMKELTAETLAARQARAARRWKPPRGRR